MYFFVAVLSAHYFGYEGLGSKSLREDKWNYIKTYVDNLQLEKKKLLTAEWGHLERHLNLEWISLVSIVKPHFIIAYS